MDATKIFWAMGILILIYLVGQNASVFDRLFSTGAAGVEGLTATLQGNPPFQTQQAPVSPYH